MWNRISVVFLFFSFGNMFISEHTYLCPLNHPDQVLRCSSSDTHFLHMNMQLPHLKYSKTCFSFFWQRNRRNARHMERLPEETNMSACHAVTLVCKQEVVCVVCVCWFLLRRSAPCQRSFTCVYTDVPLWADGCVFGPTNKARRDFLYSLCASSLQSCNFEILFCTKQ